MRRGVGATLVGALWLAACTGRDKPAYEPLPADAITAAPATSGERGESLPAGCGEMGERVTLQYSLGEEPGPADDSVPTITGAALPGAEDEDATAPTLAGGEADGLPGSEEGDDQVATTDSTAPAEPPDPDLSSIDVYTLPAACGARPVVFWLHGGRWTDGDKRDDLVTAAVAASNGWVLVAVNHRLAGGNSGVQWPVFGDDAAAAVGYALDRAGELGIDPQRVAVVGHDSGAQIAGMLTNEPQLLADAGWAREDVDCAVLLEPLGLDIPLLIDAAPDDAVQMVEQVFGLDFRVYQRASPAFVLTQVSGTVADTMLVTAGNLELQAALNDYAELVRATGALADVAVVSGYGRDEIADLWETAADDGNKSVLAFLQRCLTA